MKLRFMWWLIICLCVGAIGLAAWTLRQPIQAGVRLLTQRSSQPEVLRFAVVGDNHGDNPIYRHIIKEISAGDYRFLLHLGDMTEFGSPAEFAQIKQLESALPFPVYHTVGNHDIKTDLSRQVFTAAWNEQPWRAIDHGQVHLVILDNGDRKVGFPSASLDWLEADLAAHTNKTVIIAYHRPFDLPLDALLGDDETAASRKTNARFKSIIGKYPPDYIFTGHLHAFIPYAVNGVPAVVSGGGGDPAQSILGGPANNNFHYLSVTVKGKKIEYNIHRVQQE